MTNKDLAKAVEKTIEEAKVYREQSPDDDFAIMAMDEYRRTLEANAYCEVGPIKKFVIGTGISLGNAISFVVAYGIAEYLSR